MKSIAIIIVLALFAISAPAQRKPSRPATAQKFNLNAEQLPRGFVGDNIAVIYGQMYSRMRPKGEYETTDQYRTRLAGAIEAYENRLLAFRFKPPHMPEVNDDYAFYFVDYNADAQEMTVRVPSKGDPEELEVNVAGTVSRSTYKAQNRFGVSAAVTRYKGRLYDIVFKWKPGRIRFKFEIPPAQAKIIGDRITTLFIGTPKTGRPYKSMIRHYDAMPIGPTMDYPYEDLTETSTIVMDMKEIWIYDRVTMKVLAKEKQ